MTGSIVYERDDGLDVPARVLRDGFEYLEDIQVGDSAQVDDGIYVVETYLADGTTFRKPVNVREGGPPEPVKVAARESTGSGVVVPGLMVLEIGDHNDPSPRRRSGWPVGGTSLPSRWSDDGELLVDRSPRGGFLTRSAPLKREGVALHCLPPTTTSVSVESSYFDSPTSMHLATNSAAALASKLAGRGHFRDSVEVLERSTDRGVMEECLLAFTWLILGDRQRIEVESLLDDNAGVPDLWVLRAHYALESGDRKLAAESLRVALRLDVPSLSRAVSHLVSMLRSLDALGIEDADEERQRSLMVMRFGSLVDYSHPITTLIGSARTNNFAAFQAKPRGTHLERGDLLMPETAVVTRSGYTSFSDETIDLEASGIVPELDDSYDRYRISREQLSERLFGDGEALGGSTMGVR